MINEQKRSKGIYDFIDQIKETSIRKHYEKPKPISESMKKKDFLYCEPPEVILQSKFLIFILITDHRCRAKQNV